MSNLFRTSWRVTAALAVCLFVAAAAEAPHAQTPTGRDTTAASVAATHHYSNASRLACTFLGKLERTSL